MPLHCSSKASFGQEFGGISRSVGESLLGVGMYSRPEGQRTVGQDASLHCLRYRTDKY